MPRRSGGRELYSQKAPGPLLSQHHPVRCRRPQQTPGTPTRGRCFQLPGGWFLNADALFPPGGHYSGHQGPRITFLHLSESPYLSPSVSPSLPGAQGQKAQVGPGRREKVVLGSQGSVRGWHGLPAASPQSPRGPCLSAPCTTWRLFWLQAMSSPGCALQM